MLEEIGKDNMFIFGHTAEEIAAMRQRGYNPWNYYEGDPELQVALQMISNDTFSHGVSGLFAPITNALLYEGDKFCVLADYRAYLDCQEKASRLYRDPDVEFDEVIPSNFDLPNLMVVAAVDQAGDPTSFTSGGDNVVIYANGFEVESYVPGGGRMAASGTSMASPNALNLAAKLFALDPDLTPGEVIDLMTEGATPRDGDAAMLLIHPQHSVELLRQDF